MWGFMVCGALIFPYEFKSLQEIECYSATDIFKYGTDGFK